MKKSSSRKLQTPRASGNPKDRVGVTKVHLDLVPPSSIAFQALAMQDGARKYGPYNFRKEKVRASIYIAACLRHLLAFQDGEENAEDSGIPHLAHALGCLGILVDAKTGGFLIDDRPPKGTLPQILAEHVQRGKK